MAGSGPVSKTTSCSRVISSGSSMPMPCGRAQRPGPGGQHDGVALDELAARRGRRGPDRPRPRSTRPRVPSSARASEARAAPRRRRSSSATGSAKPDVRLVERVGDAGLLDSGQELLEVARPRRCRAPPRPASRRSRPRAARARLVDEEEPAGPRGRRGRTRAGAAAAGASRASGPPSARPPGSSSGSGRSPPTCPSTARRSALPRAGGRPRRPRASSQAVVAPRIPPPTTIAVGALHRAIRSRTGTQVARVARARPVAVARAADDRVAGGARAGSPSTSAIGTMPGARAGREERVGRL